jgi:predicted DNA-binding transcriptional regulator AlpA
MSTVQSKKPPAQSAPQEHPKYKYLGLNESGRIRLKLESKTLLINGAVYASNAPAPGHTKVVLVPVNSTPGYKRAQEHKKYLAHTDTGETFRIIGTVEKILGPSAPIQRKSVRTILGSAANAPVNSPRVPAPTSKYALPATVPLPAKPALSEPIDAKKQAKLARLQKEFQRVNIQRASGIDPSVRMAFAAHYLGESESNLYRRRAEGQFPKPIQRGKGTFWLMSDLDAFKAGTWKEST